MQTIMVTTMIPLVRICTCILHARILHTARSLVFVLPDADDAAGAGRVKLAEHAGAEGSTGNDSDSSEDLNISQVPRKSLMNTKPHAACLIGRRK